MDVKIGYKKHNDGYIITLNDLIINNVFILADLASELEISAFKLRRMIKKKYSNDIKDLRVDATSLIFKNKKSTIDCIQWLENKIIIKKLTR